MGKPKARRKAKKARYKATTQEDKIVKAAHADKGKLKTFETMQSIDL